MGRLKLKKEAMSADRLNTSVQFGVLLSELLKTSQSIAAFYWLERDPLFVQLGNSMPTTRFE
jgi:hypothetical protein